MTLDDTDQRLIALLRNDARLPIAKLAAVQALEARSPLFTANAEKRVKVARYDGPSDWIEL